MASGGLNTKQPITERSNIVLWILEIKIFQTDAGQVLSLDFSNPGSVLTFTLTANEKFYSGNSPYFPIKRNPPWLSTVREGADTLPSSLGKPMD